MSKALWPMWADMFLRGLGFQLCERYISKRRLLALVELYGTLRPDIVAGPSIVALARKKKRQHGKKGK